MFHEEFYPTPPSLAAKLVSGIKGKNLSILDPSAGSGNLLDAVLTNLKNYTPKLYAIEPVPELQTILQGKKHRLIGTDFLTYKGDYLFDYIIMNPPFSDGDKHLLRAWDIMSNGEIRCILPKAMLENTYSASRKLLLDIISQHGSVEDVGSPFRDAERKTPVECVIVKLTKIDKSRKIKFEFENDTTPEININEEVFTNQVMRNDLVGNMILQFDNAKDAFVDFIKAFQKLKFYGTGLADTARIALNSIAMANHSSLYIHENVSANGAYNEFIDEVKGSMWRSMLGKTNVDKYMTVEVRKNFQEFTKQQGFMEFTHENVNSLVSMIFENRHNIMKAAIEHVFDVFTKYYEDNRCHIEGWKTNSAWKVNRTVILPYYVEMGYGLNFSPNHRKYDEYADIERVMCYISGISYDELTKPVPKDYQYNTGEHEKEYKYISLSTAIKRTRYGDNGWQRSHFFEFRCFKKQTIHIRFRDEWLWNEFNRMACDARNWLPPAEKKKWEEEKRQRANVQPNTLQLTNFNK